MSRAGVTPWEVAMFDAMDKKVGPAPEVQYIKCSSSRKALWLFSVLSFLGSGFGQEIRRNSADVLTSLIPAMEEAQSKIQLPRHVTREYRLGTDSEVVATVDFTPPGKYGIQKHSGSNRAEQVVRRILEHEIEIALSTQKSQSTAVTTENYDFRYIGEGVLNGRPCHLLQMRPKRQQTELVSGRAWIDQQSSLISRIEGELAKSPSWWVKRVHVDLRFTSSGQSWLQTSMEAVAEVRCIGPQKLTSRVLDYDSATLAAENNDRLRISWSAPDGH